MGKYNEELVGAGIMLVGEGLHPSSQGARMRFSGTTRTVIDGPFAETKELIAGFWLWQVESMQQAIEWLKRCPNPMNEDSEIEIRRVFAADDFGEQFTPELREQEAGIRANTLGLNSPRFEQPPELLIAGLNQSYTMETRIGIPQQWERFILKAESVAGKPTTTCYGVCWKSTEWGMVRLIPEQQQMFCDAHANAFQPCNGAWGRQGYTNVKLPVVKTADMRSVLNLAIENAVESQSRSKSASRPTATKRQSKNSKSVTGLD